MLRIKKRRISPEKEFVQNYIFISQSKVINQNYYWTFWNDRMSSGNKFTAHSRGRHLLIDTESAVHIFFSKKRKKPFWCHMTLPPPSAFLFIDDFISTALKDKFTHIWKIFRYLLTLKLMDECRQSTKHFSGGFTSKTSQHSLKQGK